MQPMWNWAVLGLILLAVEMLSGTFYVLWFGVAALLISALLWLLPETSLAIQLLLFSALSLGSLFVWRNYYSKHSPDLKIGQSQGDEIGRVGTITIAVSPSQNGRIQFAQGVMGSREWEAIADTPINIGQQAVIIAVEGNCLRVKPQ